MMKLYQPKRQADVNQQCALAKMRGREFFALLMAMRTRKTKVALDDFGELELKGEVRDLLVIAPGGVYRTWVEAINADLSEDLRERLRGLMWVSSANMDAAIPEFLTYPGPRALLVNVEALSVPSKARSLVVMYLRQRPDQTYVVIDESTCIKNKSKRTRFILEQVKPFAKYRRILSGLATPRNLLDVYFQMYFLNRQILGTFGTTLFNGWDGFRNCVAFTKQESFGGRRNITVIDEKKGVRGFRPEMIEAVKDAIEPVSYRVEFRPNIPSTFEIREVELTKQQKLAYAEMKKFATTKLASGSSVTATVVIAQIVRLHQILLGHTIDEDGVEHKIPENRTAAVLDILRDYGGKAIIWCSYGHDVIKLSAAIYEEFGEPVMRFWGGNEKSREEEELRFRTDPSARFLVATPDAGGKGRTWDVADLAIFYSNRNNLELRDQAEMRTMGRDKSRGVDNIDLVVPGTVDEKILHALRAKLDMASTINGDNWRQWVV
jgi:SNF2-related domain